MSQLKLLLLCFLLRSGPALGCDWDQSTDLAQNLDPAALEQGARYLTQVTESDSESCRAACCDHPDCDLALVGLPADGQSQCVLVACKVDGRDACALLPNPQFQVFRKAVQTKASGDQLHVVPLLESVEPRSNGTSTARCLQPMKVGSCRAAFPRFFYNVTSQSCSGFIYGGCEANDNNFESQQDCEATCSGVTGAVLADDSTAASPPPPAKAPRMAPADFSPQRNTKMSAVEFSEHCEAESKVGPCRAAIKRWYFNKETGTCQTFIYGGCRGNKNNYNDEESCKATCTGVTVLPSSGKPDRDRNPADNKEHCLLSPEQGNCRAAFPKFYYDSGSASCQSFVFGGCGGNANNFDSLEDCMKSCGVSDWFDGRGKTRNRWTAAFFLFVTLAVVCVLLLATLVIITLRRRLPRRPSSVSDKQELLPEPDELSSLDSMTVPETPKPEPKA